MDLPASMIIDRVGQSYSSGRRPAPQHAFGSNLFLDVGIVIALYPSHNRFGVEFLQSVCKFETAPREAVPVGFILSADRDAPAFRAAVQRGLPASCHYVPWATVAWESIQLHYEGQSQPLSAACPSPHCRCSSLRTCYCTGKHAVLGLKKFAGILYFGFNLTLVLDAEARLVKPARLRHDLFSTFARSPSYWYDYPKDGGRNWQMGSASTILGVPEETLCDTGPWCHSRGRQAAASRNASFCSLCRSFFSIQHWFYHREWFVEMVAQIEATHGTLRRGLCGFRMDSRGAAESRSLPGLSPGASNAQLRVDASSDPISVYDAELAFAFLRLWSQRHNKTRQYPFYHATDFGVWNFNRGASAFLNQFNAPGPDSRTWRRMDRMVANTSHPVLVFADHGPSPYESSPRFGYNATAVRRYVCAHPEQLFLQVVWGERGWDCSSAAAMDATSRTTADGA